MTNNAVVAENERLMEEAKRLLIDAIRLSIKAKSTERISVEITNRRGSLVGLKRSIETLVQ